MYFHVFCVKYLLSLVLYHGFLTFSYNFCHFPLVLHHWIDITQVIVNGFEYFQISKFESGINMQEEQYGSSDVCVRR